MMKTFFTTVNLFVFVIFNTSAQPFYIKAGGGYAVGCGNSDFDKGFNTMIVAGTSSPRKINATFRVTYTSGTMRMDDQRYHYTLFTFSERSNSSEKRRTNRTYFSKTFNLIPGITFSPVTFKTWKPYMQLGLNAGFGKTTSWDKFGDTTVLSTIQSRMLGISGGLGVEYSIKNQLSLFAETGFDWLHYGSGAWIHSTIPYEYEYHSYFVVDKILSFMDLESKQFKNSSFNVGIKYTFAKKKPEELQPVE